MKATVWVIMTCISERGEGTCLPHIYGNEAAAHAAFDTFLREEWNTCEPTDDDGDPLPYPGAPFEANRFLRTWHGDGSWGEWQITAHEVEFNPKAAE